MSKQSDQKTFIIIDGNAIIHRAYHAIPPMSTKDGTIVNAAFGFASMLLKVIDEMRPNYIAVSFDVAGGTFRDEIYEDYKGTREEVDQDLYDQIPLVYDIVEAFDIPIFTKEGFEADDVIATVVAKNKKKHAGVHNIIVSGDMDLLQLVDEQTHVYAPRKDQVFDIAGVQEKYGFGPEHVVTYKSLKGDSSDNIPGVRGIGDKGAKRLIAAFGGLQDMYKAAKDDTRRAESGIKDSVFNKLEDGKEDAEMSEALATIERNVPGVKFVLDECATHEFDVGAVESLFKKFEFFSLLKRIPGRASSGSKGTNDKKQTNFKSKITMIKSESDLKALMKILKKEKVVACKEVLSGGNVLTSELLGVVFVVGAKSFYVEGKNFPPMRVGEEGSFGALDDVFQSDKTAIVGHNLKTLYKALALQHVVVEAKLFDIMIASYVVNSSTRAHDLRSIVMRELGVEMPVASEQTSLFGVDPQMVADELQYTLAVHEQFSTKLKDMDDAGLFQKVEMALIPVLAEMELNGIAIDEGMLGKLSKDIAKTIEKLTKNIYKEAGEEFNIASSVQLREVLFEKMELPTDGIKKGKTGYSTAASELEKLREHSPIIEMIEEFREVEKLRNTYVDVLPGLVNKETGRIHTTFNQAVASTGRLSSSDPNMQNIPIRTEMGRKIRDAFVAAPGYTLIAADYSQIELRIVASLAKDTNMIKIFEAGQDIHAATAAKIQGVKLTDVTKEMRSKAKAVNFGILYGMGAFGLAARTKMPQWEAKEFIEKYFDAFAGVKKYMDAILKQAKKDGYVETLFGRRRYVPELSSANYQVRSAGERMAINMPVQGTAADIMKMAMIKVHEKLKGKKDVKMSLQVHDELVLEVKKGLEGEVGEMVKSEMEEVVALNVPVEVDVNTGARWGGLK